MKHQQIALRLHRAIRELPRYNQFGVASYGLKLPPIVVHVLIELDATPRVSFSELVGRMAVEQTAISKVVSQLVDAGLITRSASKDDARVRLLSLTKRGLGAIREFDTLAEQRMERFECHSHLTLTEQERLSHLLDRVAKAFGSPHSPRRSHEHPARPALRRIARSLGLLGRRALGSDLNPLEWQLLVSICDNPGSLTPLEACALMDTPKPALAIALRELLQRGYILKTQSALDKRSFFLSPRPKGWSILAQMEHTALERYSSLSGLAERDVELLERLVRGAAVDYHLIRRGLTVAPLPRQEMSETRRAALQFYLDRGVREIPVSVFPPDARCVGMYRANELIAAVEFEDARERVVQNLFHEQRTLPETMRAFIAYAADEKLKSCVRVSHTEVSAFLTAQKGYQTVLGLLFR